MESEPYRQYLAVKSELEKVDTSQERVQEVFAEWWGRRSGDISFEEGAYVLPVQVPAEKEVAGDLLLSGWLRFPVEKLTREQVTRMADAVSDGYITWGAGRAAAIALVPLPLADVAPLMANEAYMIYRIAACHGYKIDQTVVSMLAGVAGGSFAGKLLASLVPFLKIPIAAGITYAVGKTAKAYFASGMTLSKEMLKEVFTSARKEADTIDWSKRTVEAEPTDSTPAEKGNGQDQK